MKKIKAAHAMVELPGLGEYGVMNYEVNSTDVLVGAGIGLVGVAVFKTVNNKLLTKADGTSVLPDFFVPFMPLIGGIVGGVGAFMLQKNSNPNRGKGHMVGAIGAGGAVSAMDFLRKNATTAEYFNDYGGAVRLDLGRYRRGYRGLIIDDASNRPYSGLIVDDPKSLSDYNLGQLASLSMGDEDSSGMEDLMGLE